MTLDPIALPVEESRAQRLQRQQARFRDRGGIFVPSNRNTLADILLGRATAGQSPRKSRARSTSRSPRKEKKRKSSGKDVHEDQIAQGTDSYKSVRSSPRKHAAKKEHLAEALEQQVAGPSRLSKAKGNKYSKAAESHEVKGPVDAPLEGKPSSRSRPKARTKSSKKKIAVTEVLEEEVKDMEPFVKKTQPASKKPRKGQSTTDSKQKLAIMKTPNVTTPKVDIHSGLSRDQKQTKTTLMSSIEGSTGKGERLTKFRSRKATSIQTRLITPEDGDAPKKSSRPGRTRSKKAEGAYAELSQDDIASDVIAKKKTGCSRSAKTKLTRVTKYGHFDTTTDKVTKVTAALSKKRPRPSDENHERHNDSDDNHRHTASRKRSKADVESKSDTIAEQDDGLARKKARSEPALTSKPSEKSQKKRSKDVNDDVEVSKIAKKESVKATESLSRKRSREEKVADGGLVPPKHKKVKKAEYQSIQEDPPAKESGERMKPACWTDKRKGTENEKQKESDAVVLLNGPKKNPSVKGTKRPPARVLNMVKQPWPEIDDNEPDPIDFLS